MSDPWMFPTSRGKWESTAWALFSNRRWYRRWKGGLWQRFDLGSPSRPFFQWLQVLKVFEKAIETEDYRK